jgi:hypothetical protein
LRRAQDGDVRLIVVVVIGKPRSLRADGYQARDDEFGFGRVNNDNFIVRLQNDVRAAEIHSAD